MKVTDVFVLGSINQDFVLKVERRHAGESFRDAAHLEERAHDSSPNPPRNPTSSKGSLSVTRQSIRVSL